MQPLIKVDNTIRFKANEIVRDLVDGLLPGDLNKIVALVHRGRYSQEDYEQLMQLIGYSVNGYCELSGVSDISKDAAEDAANNFADN